MARALVRMVVEHPNRKQALDDLGYFWPHQDLSHLWPGYKAFANLPKLNPDCVVLHSMLAGAIDAKAWEAVAAITRLQTRSHALLQTGNLDLLRASIPVLPANTKRLIRKCLLANAPKEHNAMDRAALTVAAWYME
jgi:hypothetical protein